MCSSLMHVFYLLLPRIYFLLQASAKILFMSSKIAYGILPAETYGKPRAHRQNIPYRSVCAKASTPPSRLGPNPVRGHDTMNPNMSTIPIRQFGTIQGYPNFS